MATKGLDPVNGQCVRGEGAAGPDGSYDGSAIDPANPHPKRRSVFQPNERPLFSATLQRSCVCGIRSLWDIAGRRSRRKKRLQRLAFVGPKPFILTRMKTGMGKFASAERIKPNAIGGIPS